MKFVCLVIFVSFVWHAVVSSVIPWPPKIICIEQPTDQFTAESRNFKQITLYEDKYWNQTGPILFYCGHEQPIVKFYNNTGFLFEYASEVKGFVIFAEHRYYGMSMPFDEQSFTYENMQYLSIAQTLKDYVKVLKDYRTRFNISDQVPVIAFGGGYGGVLAGLMRLNFPAVVEGALVSSAPLTWLAGKRRVYGMFVSVSKVYKKINTECPIIIKEAYKIIQNASTNNLTSLSKSLKLCKNLTDNNDTNRLIHWSRRAFVIMAMMNYPYSSNFFYKLPPAPLNISCERVLKYSTSTAIEALRDAVDVFYNSTGQLKCFDIYSGYDLCADVNGCNRSLSSRVFDYQTCKEMPPGNTSKYGYKEMFLVNPVSSLNITEYCFDTWRLVPKNFSLSRNYSSNFTNTSNVIFSNGSWDPRLCGGILQNVSTTVVAFNISGGAHHYDLRESNNNDSSSVQDVRRREKLVMGEWIKNFISKHEL